MKKILSNTTSRIFASIPVFIILVSFAFAPAATNPETYSLSTIDMKISGTSNLHDWTMKAGNAKCNASFELKANNALNIVDVNALEFSVPVKGLKSEHDLMDSRAQSTLKGEKYPSIIFKLTSAEVTPQAANKYNIKATGNMTIGGVSKTVVLNTTGVLNADKSIVVNGQQKIKMSEWQIKPPSFMLGALKVGDMVTVDFNLKLID